MQEPHYRGCMPELPVIRALAERIHAVFGGKEVDNVTLIQFAALKTVRPGLDVITGRMLHAVSSRGKYLDLGFGDHRVVIHLSQAGRIMFESPAKDTRGRGGVVRIRFAGDGEARSALFVHEFGRERRVGLWVLDAGEAGPTGHLGPEPFDAEFAAWLDQATDRRRLHTMLRDQRTVAGIGRGHADDILHRAHLAPTRTLSSLDSGERGRLLEAIRSDLGERIDREKKRKGGLPAKLSEDWRVHGRYGEPCPDCGAELARISYEDYEITYCPQCQTGGRVLADRRRSRFLR